MSRTLLEIESILQQMIVEHRKLLKHLEAHQEAMKKMALDEMDKCGNQQEATRLRISSLETTRKTLVSISAMRKPATTFTTSHEERKTVLRHQEPS